MDSQKIDFSNFVDILKVMVGSEIYIGCCEGRICYHGEMINVSNNLINVLENGVKHIVYIDNICFIIFYNKEGKAPKPLETVNSVLFERFHYFLSKRIEITRVNASCWAIEGRLEYIENDYLVVIEESEESVIYIHALDAFYIKSLRVFED